MRAPQSILDFIKSAAKGPTPNPIRMKVEIKLLQDEVERLLMMTEALWAFLKKEHRYTDKQLIEKIVEIDLRDGKLDGRVAPEGPTPCPECRKPLTRRRYFCIYCGKQIEKYPFER